MSRLEIHPFSDEFLAPAGELLAARHGAHRAAEPLLPPRYEQPRAAAAEIEELAGVEGFVRQYSLVPASEPALVEAWARVGFGQQHAYGIRDVPEVAWPEGVRLAEERDIEALVELSPLLAEHQAQSPVFGIGLPRETPDEIRAEILEDLPRPEIGDLVVERDGRIVGAFQIVPVELSSVHSGLARPEGAALLGWAATDPEVRGSGAGLALTDGSFAWARERGYETMVTDWRVTNLLSSRFWPARGFRPTFLRLYRHIP